MFFVLFVGCLGKLRVDTNKPSETQKETIFNEEEKEDFSGTYIDGVFRDKTFPLEGVVSDSWNIQPQNRVGSLRFRAQHTIEFVTVEIWQFSEIMLQPAEHDFCSWSFLDRGYYSNTHTKQITSTCIPHNTSGIYVFAYIYHWGGSTWQFEIHTDMQESIGGKKTGEALLQQFTWNGDEDIQVLQP